MGPVSDRVYAVVHWISDDKSGIEPLSHVQEGARHVGLITKVKFHGDNKAYNAKIVKISSDLQACEDEAEALDEKISASQKELPRKRSRKSTMRAKSPSVASEKAVALATGGRPPVPSHLMSVKKATLKERKDNKACHSKGQDLVDNEAMTSIRRNLFESNDSSQQGAADTATLAESSSEMGDEQGSAEDKALSSDNHWCSCSPCQILQKYNTASTKNFLGELTSLLSVSAVEGKRYLALIPISASVKQVELTAGKNVMISLHDKLQLKVDYADKPSALIRETLFVLYGRQAFQTSSVTTRGTKPGTVGIHENVLEALLGFVNRNVRPDLRMKKSQLAQSINKRASDWRKVCVANDRESSKISKTKKIDELKATSPWKVTPTKDNQPCKEIQKSPRIHTPKEKSPMKNIEHGRGPLDTHNMEDSQPSVSYSNYPQYNQWQSHQYPYHSTDAGQSSSSHWYPPCGNYSSSQSDPNILNRPSFDSPSFVNL